MSLNTIPIAIFTEFTYSFAVRRRLIKRHFQRFFFFYLYWGNVVLWLKRISTKKLANRINYQIWYKGCLKGKFDRGVQICEGGSISVSGPNPRGVQIRWHRSQSGYGPPANLDPVQNPLTDMDPRSKSANGYGPPFQIHLRVWNPLRRFGPRTKLSFQASFVSYLVTNSICKLFVDVLFNDNTKFLN